MQLASEFISGLQYEKILSNYSKTGDFLIKPVQIFEFLCPESIQKSVFFNKNMDSA